MKKQLKIGKELTPKEHVCVVGPCPAIFETNNGSYAIIGKVLDARKLGVDKRIGKNEVLIEVPKKIVDDKK